MGWVLWSQDRRTLLFHGVGTFVPGQTYPPGARGGYFGPRTDVPSCFMGWVHWSQDRCTACHLGWVLWSQARCTPLFYGVGTLVPGQMYLWGGVGIFVLGHFYPGYRGILVRVHRPPVSKKLLLRATLQAKMRFERAKRIRGGAVTGRRLQPNSLDAFKCIQRWRHLTARPSAIPRMLQ